MKRFFEGVVNQGLKKQLKALYGENTNVIVEDFYWSEKHSRFEISLIIYTDNIDYSVEIHPDGIEYIVEMALTMLSRNKPTRLITSLKYSENGTSDTTL